jgi:DNA invertase Pin-like site-specific DNA recombinase
MAQANSLSPIGISAVKILARLAAKRAVQENLRAQGVRVSLFPHAELRRQAAEYLSSHPELYQQALERAQRMIAEGVFGKRAQFCCAYLRFRMGVEMIVGYARVSTDQTLDCQQAELRKAGVERVYSEKISGAVTDRPALAKAIGALGNGDTLMVCKLDRLARSTRDLLNTLAEITQRGSSFKSLGDSWADTTPPAGKLMLTVLGGLAEYERHLILARTSEGRQRAQQRGVRFGRKRKLTLHQQQEALARRAAGEALVEIARSYAVSHSTISRLA